LSELDSGKFTLLDTVAELLAQVLLQALEFHNGRQYSRGC
jgi:hypothetical protein